MTALLSLVALTVLREVVDAEAWRVAVGKWGIPWYRVVRYRD